jgi:6-phosphogluconolactonase (cycloisomerase 2 family)
VTLTSLPSADVTITVTPDGQTDLGSGPNNPITLTFTGANGTTPQAVSVVAVNDTAVEGAHTSTITHSAISTDSAFDGIAIRDVTVTITDNDGLIAITEVGGSTDVAEGSLADDTYEVVLTVQPTSNVTVAVAPDVQTAADPTLLTFSPNDWNAPRVVTVTAVDDPVLEGAHISTITHSASSSDIIYDGTTINEVTVNITDNDRFAYVTNIVQDVGNGEITAYSIDPSTGALTEIPGSPFLTKDHPNWVAVEPVGRYLYVTNSDSNNISGYNIDAASGNLSPIPGSPFPTGILPGWVAIHPSGKFAYVTHRTAPPANLRAFAIDESTGSLSFIAAYSAGNDAREVAVDPTGSFLYVANFGSNNVSAYTIDQTNGRLTIVPGSPFPAETDPQSLTVDPSGQFAYVANFASNTISAFRIEDGTTPGGSPGSLSFIAAYSAGNGPRNVTVEPTGQYAYVANRFTHNVSAFRIDPATGALAEISGSPFSVIPGLDPRQVAVDPTGTFAFVADHDSNNVSAFIIDPATGALQEITGSPFQAGIRTLSITTIGVIP